jgi:hypothetical protein
LIGLATLIACLAATSGTARAGCITRLPVSATFASKFAASYSHSVPVRISTRGPRIRSFTVAIYTFKGELLGRGRAKHTIRSATTVKIKLRYPLQAGKFTLVMYGEPNASPSCGPKHKFQVVHFRGCMTTLPVTFPSEPTGLATDYGSQVTVNVASAGWILSDVEVSLTSFSGFTLGTRHLAVLYGQESPTFDLSSGLQPGGYTLTATGLVKAQPPSCGPKSAKTVLKFG